MPRYFKLGVSKHSDRDTYLFQGPDPIPKQGDLLEEEDEFETAAAPGADAEEYDGSKWAPPFLRRAQSSRERPVVAPPPQQQQQQQHHHQVFKKRVSEQQQQQQQQPSVACLRRAISSREQRQDLWSRLGAADDKLGPLEAAVQRGFGVCKQPPQYQQQQQQNGFLAPNGAAPGYGFLDHVKQQQHLPRAQSMRYNRIISSEEPEEAFAASGAVYGGVKLAPPRHSSFTGTEGFYHPPKAVAAAAAAGDSQKLVVVSASFQTGEGEILSIECAKCGRWLGTVAQRVSLDEGMLKLCQICHPREDDPKLLVPPLPSTYYEPPLAEGQGSPGAKLRKRSGFVRGLRRMLGLKKKPLYSFTTAAAAAT